ncbi:hypothetical protein JHK87_055824 [Glycine soja]|nr:hypothetical protein JHK87_055824 [Glycine soja]
MCIPIDLFKVTVMSLHILLPPILKYEIVSMFSPLVLLLSGEAHSIKVEKILYKEKSEFQEVLVFEVLVVGGRDGSVVREVAHHSSVEHIDICEIDKMVTGFVDFFPTILVTVDFLKSVPEGKSDAIIVDSSDLVGMSFQ